jgi:glucokinase-like ROK family protein
MKDAMFLGQTINKIKAHNMRAVLLGLLYNAPTSRTQLARDTSLSTTTITNLVDELMELGIVQQGGPMTIEGKRRVGRPRKSLSLVPDAHHALGIHLGAGRYRVGLANLKGEIVYERAGTFSRNDPRVVLESILSVTEEAMAASGVDREQIIGIGLGAAGLVDHQRGVITFSPNLGWRNVPVGDFFSEHLGLPTVVENNVAAMALGESIFGVGRGFRSLIFVYSRMGLGAGIVVDNRILRGNSIAAGEIGHTIMMADGGESCRCGNAGCLETLVSERALIARARELAEERADTSVAQQIHYGSDGLTVDDVFEAARQDDICAETAVEEVSCYFGYALANMINLINPELILLGGMFAQGDDLFIPLLERTIRETAFEALGSHVELRSSGFGAQASIVGAATLALTNLFYLDPEEL